MCKSCYMIINIICKCNLAKGATFSVGFKLKNIMFQKVLHSRCNDRLQTKATQFGCRRIGKVEPSFWILKSHFLVFILPYIHHFLFSQYSQTNIAVIPSRKFEGKGEVADELERWQILNLLSCILYLVADELERWQILYDTSCILSKRTGWFF